MPLLIDGYNLVHVAGILGQGVGPGSLQRSRLALLNFLAESLDPGELPHTTVVFDSHDAPSGSAAAGRTSGHHGPIRHAVRGGRRPDRGVDPGRFGAAAAGGGFQRPPPPACGPATQGQGGRQRRLVRRAGPCPAAASRGIFRRSSAQPAVPLLEEDVNYWLRQFGGESALTELLDAGKQPQSDPHPTNPRRARPARSTIPSRRAMGKTCWKTRNDDEARSITLL